jgi:hypothetical protein
MLVDCCFCSLSLMVTILANAWVSNARARLHQPRQRPGCTPPDGRPRLLSGARKQGPADHGFVITTSLISIGR